MALNGTEVLKRLLQANYYPRVASSADELPPCFSSSSWSPSSARTLAASPGRRGGYDAVAIEVTRFNLVPRRLELPHPRAFARLAVLIESEWPQLKHISNSAKSRIKPTAFADGRVVSMLGSRGRRVSKFGSRFLASADINSFYPSLYTHAIPWALVGKSHAKTHRNPSDWFNQLDLRIRDCKRGETVGVAVGPGTSAIAAEVVLNAIDADSSLKKFRYERFIDDYLLHAASREEAEEFLMALSGALRQYNLHLNPRKTQIAELPLPKTPAWIRQLKTAARHIDAKNVQDVLDFLDLAIEVTQVQPDASALKYALAILEKRLNRPLPSSQIGIIARALLSLAFHRPVALPFLVRFLQKKRANLSAPMARHVDELLVHHSLSRRTDAVSWLLYLVEKQGIALRRSTEKIILDSVDCLALVLLWHVGSIKAKRDVEVFAKSLISSMVDDYERDQYWLLLYELQRAKLIKRPYGPNDNDFKTLINAGVKFVDFDTRLKAPPRASSISPYSVTE